MKKGQEATSLEEIRKRVRDAGLRCTTARLAVLEYLTQATSPLTHAEVSEALSPHGFDRATIYRNLIELTESGLLSRIELGDHVWRFEVKRPGHDHQQDHPHFVCIDCGEVSCLPEATVSVKPVPGTKQSGIRDITEILLRGHCGECT